MPNKQRDNDKTLLKLFPDSLEPLFKATQVVVVIEAEPTCSSCHTLRVAKNARPGSITCHMCHTPIQELRDHENVIKLWSIKHD